MAPLSALSEAWVSAAASLPHAWQISGLWRFEDRRVVVQRRMIAELG